MKKTICLIVFSFVLLCGCGPTHVVVREDAPEPPPPAPEVSYQSFYDELSPYGQWVDYPGYGYVWMPNAGPGFKPYATGGHWVYTDAGWTWASDYSWGWAPFHYGRWFFDAAYGWMWVPGNEWAPAWVSWRSSADYYGWAPLGPNVSVNIAVGSYNPPSNYWCFVPHQYITNAHINSYYINESRNVTIINNTTIINNRTVVNNNYRNVYSGGPERQEAERYTGAPIRPMLIRENNRPGEQMNNGQYAIYRPRVNSSTQQSGGAQRVAPARVEQLRNIRPAVNNNSAGNNNSSNNNPGMNRPATNYPPNERQRDAMNNNNNNRPAENRLNNSNVPANPNGAVNNNNNPASGNNGNNNHPNRYDNNYRNPANANPAPASTPVMNPQPNNNVQAATGNRPVSDVNRPVNTNNNNNVVTRRNPQMQSRKPVAAPNTVNGKPGKARTYDEKNKKLKKDKQ